MTLADIERLQRKAEKQAGLQLGMLVAVMPGELLGLLRLARIGAALEEAA